MQLPLCSLILLPLFGSAVRAEFLGPHYASPRDISSNQSYAASGWRTACQTLAAYLRNDSQGSSSGAIPGIANITFSVGMFSVNDPVAAEMQFHHTSHEVANATNGTHKVDGDSIYRIASVTKVFSVLAAMLELKDADWERPLTEIFPTLAEYMKTAPQNAAYATQWDKITLSALGAQIAGVPREGYPNIGEVLLQLATGVLTEDPTALGFPPLNTSDPLVQPPCAVKECTAAAFIEGVADRAPVFLPWTTPAYSNNGFILFGQALVKLTGKSFDQLYRETIFDPLGMSSSNSSTPPVSMWGRSVIPGDISNFAIDSTTFVASGGLLSTIHDLAKFGTSILNSTLLPTEETRRWLKPVSHTAHLQYSIGRPWEIVRYTHASGVVTDIYTKSGDSGQYSGYLVLVPDYNVGFSILSAGTSSTRFDIVAAIADVVINSVVPALDIQARTEAEKNFVGTYKSTIPGLNSSMALITNGTDCAAPGLEISSWISNGTNVLQKMSKRLGTPPYRLVPSVADPQNGQMAFRLITATDGPRVMVPKGLLVSAPGMIHGDWILVDAATYGGIGQSLFVFDIGPDGNATSLSPAAFRVILKRSM
ncbi:beta-lactamase/transpeptidase-like protein [Thozetella sp. PMI_491]|nr:beta-lactamase/transpeptidase-like protein [Thozetella sp. PMI_491]